MTHVTHLPIQKTDPFNKHTMTHRSIDPYTLQFTALNANL